jgi:hypothetical protein
MFLTVFLAVLAVCTGGAVYAIEAVDRPRRRAAAEATDAA